MTRQDPIDLPEFDWRSALRATQEDLREWRERAEKAGKERDEWRGEMLNLVHNLNVVPYCGAKGCAEVIWSALETSRAKALEESARIVEDWPDGMEISKVIEQIRALINRDNR